MQYMHVVHIEMHACGTHAACVNTEVNSSRYILAVHAYTTHVQYTHAAHM